MEALERTMMEAMRLAWKKVIGDLVPLYDKSPKVKPVDDSNLKLCSLWRPLAGVRTWTQEKGALMQCCPTGTEGLSLLDVARSISATSKVCVARAFANQVAIETGA